MTLNLFIHSELDDYTRWNKICFGKKLLVSRLEPLNPGFPFFAKAFGKKRHPVQEL